GSPQPAYRAAPEPRRSARGGALRMRGGERMKPKNGRQYRPLVTFAVLAYQQEDLIRQAIEAAFAQTYSPLEIILSDDGSGDRTFEVIERMAAAYDGPHSV